MSHDDLIIRPAKPEDERELAVLDRASWSTLSDVSPQPREEADGVFDERHTPDQYLLALADGRIVGYVRHVPPTPLATNRHVRQIQGLAVDTAARGRGIGRKLVEAACEAARADGARRMTLRVLGWNAPARRLYESCGFVVEGSLAEEFVIDGTYVDDILMARSLSD
ncbi:GNAT family N-acetyltransferase [Streptomyces kaniharaensis]|uniref:GNAT family N-acetyltransferase n=1 Tax=Streptomyces kaniharaensis TaxID=212423 RepID=A0A6N7KNL4_9ACTN|nr:GNAT family N-acetyltransferase [Streptomyces kaniharaensis]MQS11937.1 GNAT family N-acetyltransferase [Streptomyces kaniharaensis]